MSHLEKESFHLNPGIICFIGPEGSGKTTQGKLLAKLIEKPYISTGDTLRELAANDDGRYGDACRKMFQEHAYLDPDLLLEILVSRFGQEDTINGFLLDGGMRTVKETVDLQPVLDKAGRRLPLIVVHLRIPGWMGMERLVTGENARGREDDTVVAVLKRMSSFYRDLAKRSTLINSHEDWKLIHIMATGTEEEVFAEVCKQLKFLECSYSSRENINRTTKFQRYQMHK